MAAAIAASLAAGGEEAAATTSVPGSPGLPGSRSAERALEEAVATGTLNLSNRRLKHFPRGAARSYDLSDITQADLSRNRFPEVPEAACQLVSLEGLSLYHNCLRCLNPALGKSHSPHLPQPQPKPAVIAAILHLPAAPAGTHCQQQQTGSPACRHQHLGEPSAACENGEQGEKRDCRARHQGPFGGRSEGKAGCALGDVSSNELQSLPTELCSLPSLRDLNVRRNQLSTLPDELGDLPLVRLDFSCNRISRIPVSFCRLRHLQVICWTATPCKARLPSPAEDLFPGRRYDGGLDSGFHSVDSGSKRWSGNESTDDFSELSFRISELAREPRGPRERKEDGCADGDPEQIDFIDSHVPGEDEERGAAKEQQPPELSPVAGDRERAPSSRYQSHLSWHLLPLLNLLAPSLFSDLLYPSHPAFAPQAGGTVWRGTAPPGHVCSCGRSVSGGSSSSNNRVECGGPSGRTGVGYCQFSEAGGQDSWWRCCSLVHSGHLQRHAQVQCHPTGSFRGTGSSCLSPHLSGAPSHRWTRCDRGVGKRMGACVVTAPAPRPLGSIQRPNSFLFRSSSQSGSGPSSPDSVLRPRRSPQLLDEKELMAQLRQVLESRLQRPLPEDLAEALANGVILCQLANQLRPRSVPFIHVPSPAVPKLSTLKSRKNVESFLEACRKMGVPEADLCSPSDLLQGTAQGLWTTLEAVKRVGGRAPQPLWPPSGLGGFILFYVVLMLLLYVVYTRLLGS
ncbi:hypothetical protein QTO34_013659 [Cnephaeus nilssonii]|uniref:Calponin-homology (CH) domain-containing protein n=1 Tax=Cnephaeus nilssonii TaxID=3371016 RepID=A0AA40LT88_CNENI|nr:hypothetical protein QTO34_013659 [Eptesicus nilssonii]